MGWVCKREVRQGQGLGEAGVTARAGRNNR